MYLAAVTRVLPCTSQGGKGGVSGRRKTRTGDDEGGRVGRGAHLDGGAVGPVAWKKTEHHKNGIEKVRATTLSVTVREVREMGLWRGGVWRALTVAHDEDVVALTAAPHT